LGHTFKKSDNTTSIADKAASSKKFSENRFKDIRVKLVDGKTGHFFLRRVGDCKKRAWLTKQFKLQLTNARALSRYSYISNHQGTQNFAMFKVQI